MAKQPHANFCGAKTRSGAPCKNRAMANGRCRMHGGKSTGPPKKNKNAVTHGLFAKYLPKETLELVEQIEDVSPLDILWMNIKVQFAAIMRAQKIMWVQSRDEMIKELKKRKYDVVEMGDEVKQIPTEEEYEFQFAWDRQATFLNSQSRAMSELRSMLKQFTEMAREDDERMLEVERMKTMITKAKKETEFIEEKTKLLKGDTKDTSLLEALIGVVNEDD